MTAPASALWNVEFVAGTTLLFETPAGGTWSKASAWATAATRALRDGTRAVTVVYADGSVKDIEVQDSDIERAKALAEFAAPGPKAARRKAPKAAAKAAPVGDRNRRWRTSPESGTDRDPGRPDYAAEAATLSAPELREAITTIDALAGQMNDRQTLRATGIRSAMVERLALLDAAAKVAAETEAAQQTGRDIPEGTYTIVFGSPEDYITLRVREGFVGRDGIKTPSILEYLAGSDNTTDFQGCAFLERHAPAFWKRFKTDGAFCERVRRAVGVLNGGTEARAGAQEAYALRSSRCARCGRALTVPASIHRGLGPECARKGAA